MSWLPIESAPKDGVALVTGRWDSGEAWWSIGHCSDCGVYGDWHADLEPTHWQPLPEPPIPHESDVNPWLDKIEADARLGDTMIGDLTLTDRTGG